MGVRACRYSDKFYRMAKKKAYEIMKKRTGGAICGGNKKYAEKLVDEAHCKKHKKYQKKCKACQDARIEKIDANFMALM